MMLQLSEFEQQILIELLDAAHTQGLHELHHTDAAGYKALLRRRLDAIEALRIQLTQVPVELADADRAWCGGRTILPRRETRRETGIDGG